MSNKTLANQFIDRGFDQTYIRGGAVHLVCSQCEALAINGMATHEQGCPNARHKCKGCNEQVAVNQHYCADCA